MPHRGILISFALQKFAVKIIEISNEIFWKISGNFRYGISAYWKIWKFSVERRPYASTENIRIAKIFAKIMENCAGRNIKSF